MPDHKTTLKEHAEQGTIGTPTYETTRVGGVDHRPAFVSTVRLPDGSEATGCGRSKKEAEQDAAATLMKNKGL